MLTSEQLPREDWKPDPEFEPLTYEKVIGLNNLLNIAWLNQGLTLAASVVRIVSPQPLGTGFMIGPDLLLTNHHVLPAESVAEPAVAEFNYQLNWAGLPDPAKRFPLDITAFRTNADLDYTIVRVAESPGHLYGYTHLSTGVDPTANDYVTIIQHPRGGPKQISLTDNKVAAIFGDLLQYSSDTEAGSSGSPVFNQSWQLVGLHHRGGELAGPDGTKYFTNEAILITSVLRDAAEFLGLGDPLYDLAFSDLRASLVNLIDKADPPRDPDALLPDLIRTRPRFLFAIDEWSKVNAPKGQNPVDALAGAGAAIGAALRQWARSSGHESITAASPSTPPPSSGLVELVSRFHGSSDLPSEVFKQVFAAIRADASLVAAIVARVNEEVSPIPTARAFLIGVTVGGSAYEPGKVSKS